MIPGVKILDRYILKSFVITFATVFVILFFIFILQTVWLFIAELAGKDLDFFLIVKFLLFAMPRIIPLVLPLSVLLASIMTFGSFAENYEFAAMKSSGISLQRAMRSLMVFIGLLAVASFFFANNVIPYAEYQFINFRADIGKKQPAMAITEGQFSDVGSFNIKVDKKSGENGNQLTGVTIHKKSGTGQGTTTVIRSKTGELMTSEESNILKLILKDGDYYEDLTPKRYEDRKKLPFAKSEFKRYIINMDLGKLNKMDESEEKVTTNNMLNVNELRYTLDSLNKDYDKNIISFADNIYQRTGILSNANHIVVKNKVDTASAPAVKTELPKDLLGQFDNTDKLALLKIASGNVESTNFSIDGSVHEMQDSIKNINNHELAFYDKFVIAYACILMFFIGAPLGAIIRKGGVGLPIVFAVLIFITFHFINTFGKKIAQSDGLPPFAGAWMSSFILTPFAVMLTYRATNDIGLFQLDNLLEPVGNLFRKIFKKKEAAQTQQNVNQA
nr:LptF/LptG family permease [Flavobacterium selenitireducens]